MIIDLILDRKDGSVEYNPKEFYNDVIHYGDIGNEIANALDGLEEEEVRKALCDYVIDNEYSPKICEYINSVKWL
jgi:hypothetical protein